MSLKNLDVKKVKYGKTERYKFGSIDEVVDFPYLMDVQRKSYEDFLTNGIRNVLRDFSPIIDTENLNRDVKDPDRDCRVELYFLDHSIEGTPKYTEAECKTRDATYSLPLKVKIRLVYKETGEVVDQEVFFGDIPLMTENGSFIINGAERAVVSQLVRAPGVYCKQGVNKAGNFVTETSIMPARGAWIDLEEDSSGVIYVHVDRSRKMVASILLRGLGLSSDEDIIAVLGNHPSVLKTLEKDVTKTEEEALVEISKRLRPGEVLNLKAIKRNLEKMFYSTRRYDVSMVGRYKYNQKLSLANRIANRTLAEDVVLNKKVLASAGEVLSEEDALKIQNAGVNRVTVVGKNGPFTIIGNNMVELKAYTGFNPDEFNIDRFIHLPTYLELTAGCKNNEQRKQVLREQRDEIVGRHLLLDDVISTYNYHLSVGEGLAELDDVDHLANRRVKAVGELLTNQFFTGMAKLERVIHGKIFDVAVDLRTGSKTFGKWVGEILSPDGSNILYIPEGFA
ncbi:MAG: dTDP-4-dehydrorhamnose 3,5-epimerase family protein, partial [Bacilli bacterium]|nr:dTDP-4-dehydrorhamnose 3,5-epimerase family protein [Bacilli bacterium]